MMRRHYNAREAVFPRAVEAYRCREDPSSASDYCGLPIRLANFQGDYACAIDVKVGRPQTKEEILQMISYYDSVKAVGVGHSWNQQQFCSGINSSAINIVMTELTSTLALIEKPQYPKPASADFPIQVNEGTLTVTAQAGVPQRILLDYLANYTTPLAPMGYSLPAFTWYIDQTIGGAVATGSHGSSLWYGGLASQVVRIEMALANGTLANFSESRNAHLWHAAQVGVGRLGVITELFWFVPQAYAYKVSAALYFEGSDNITNSFATPALIRFLAAEDAYISVANGEPQILLNFEDDLSEIFHKENAPFQAIISIFVKQCGARLHWSKAGWPTQEPCYNGVAHFPTHGVTLAAQSRSLTPAQMHAQTAVIVALAPAR
ncbi:hypothetical protein WJX73_008541 [Symbiochloris irregularis]|uniref:FAD-binding PCMH-type domain-containing protein n=1 Tax=Symbiochloris irregularis TaxID=706552 RepID=A0AAW1NRH4_9CHLO